MSVNIVHHLADTIRVFGEEHGQAARIGFDIMNVRRHKGDDLSGEIPLPTMPL
jgi:hypothetical protein